ncbi:MAG: hypothetical protein WCJ24_01230 [Candidatus Saccharibacteria bacterium]
MATTDAKKTKPVSERNKKINKNNGFWRRVAITSMIAAFFLIIANSAIWVNQAIFNTDNFAATAVSSITSDSSRQALAQEVVDRALVDRPVIKNVVGSTATKLISGLLDSDRFTKVLTVAVSKLQVYLTSSQQKSITLDLTGVKSTIDKLITLADSTGLDVNANGERVNNLPDQLVLVDANNVPSFYTYAVIFMWVAPLCVLMALALLVYPYFRDRRRYYQIALVQGTVIAVTALLLLLLGPLFRPPVLSNVTSPNMRIVVENMYNAFIALFNNQAYIMFGLGVVLALLPLAAFYGLQFYNQKTSKSTK